MTRNIVCVRAFYIIHVLHIRIEMSESQTIGWARAGMRYMFMFTSRRIEERENWNLKLDMDMDWVLLPLMLLSSSSLLLSLSWLLWRYIISLKTHTKNNNNRMPREKKGSRLDLHTTFFSFRFVCNIKQRKLANRPKWNVLLHRTTKKKNWFEFVRRNFSIWIAIKNRIKIFRGEKSNPFSVISRRISMPIKNRFFVFIIFFFVVVARLQFITYTGVCVGK